MKISVINVHAMLAPCGHWKTKLDLKLQDGSSHELFCEACFETKESAYVEGIRQARAIASQALDPKKPVAFDADQNLH